MPRACSQCGCTEIDTDPARGDAVCTNCGTVLEDQIIVSEVQYQENAAGGASVIGQFVANDGTRANTFKGPMGHGFSTDDARKLVLENGYKRLKEMGGKLRMFQSSIDTAFGFFKMAVAHRFTRGRKMEYVLASCLYLVCRVDPSGSEDLELMLIDFSDLVQVNVHILGRTFVQLAAELAQNIRIVDPIIYIRRFANQLHFGDKLNKVVESATRLVARMKRDWMHTGRRPAGLCGAALLLSARMHNFNRTIDQIIRVVKVCEGTIRTRLLEFESTPSAQLTIEEFDNVDLEEEQDPPCFTEGKRKAKLAQMMMEQKNFKEGDFSENVVKELSKFEQNINKSLKRKLDTNEASSSEKISDADQALKRLGEDVLQKAAGPDWGTGEWEGIGGPAKVDLGAQEDSQDGNMICVTKEESEGDQAITKVESGELDLTGIDDAELDKLIMTEEEVAHKAKWFDIEFGDYMEIVKEREAKRKIKEEAAAKKKRRTPQRPKKHKGGYDREAELAECMEILRKDIAEKKFSDKIDYNVLKSLEASSTTTAAVVKGEAVVGTVTSAGDGGRTVVVEDAALEREEESKRALLNRFKKQTTTERSLPDKKKNVGKRVRIDVADAEEEESKKSKIEPDKTVVEESTPAVIIEEATPAAYSHADDGLEDEEFDEEDEDEEVADDILSARRLLGHDASAYDEEEEDYY